MPVIYCDESGYTGTNLLEPNQPYFVYSGIKLSDEEKEDAIKLIHDNYKVQGEIKGQNLVKNEKGQKAIIKLYEKFGDNARIVFCNKKFSLAAKIFEYAVEPNLKSNMIAYQIGFHKFISTSIYQYFMEKGNEAEEIFQSFLSELTGNKKVASVFTFDPGKIEHDVMKWIFEIVQYKPEVFFKEITTDEKIDTWILDLTSTSLTGILTDWGKNNESLTVVCDNSNLFKEPAILRSINTIGANGTKANFLGSTIGFSLTEDVILSDSKMEPGLQIADLFSSALGYSLRNKDQTFSKTIFKIFAERSLCKPDCFCIEAETEILKDKTIADLCTRLMRIIRKVQQEEG